MWSDRACIPGQSGLERRIHAANPAISQRPRVSDVVNQQTTKFTIYTLVEMLSRVGKPVKLTVG